MSSAFHFLAWDSDFLGFPVARLQPAATDVATVQAALSQARAQGCRLLYWAVSPTDEQAAATARQLGLYLATQRVTYALTVADEPAGLPAGIGPVTALTAPRRRLALLAGHQSRYRTDPRFAADVYERLYSRWIERSVSGELAREVLVYRPAPHAPETGLLTLECHESHVSIGLLAVAGHLRGQGVGTRLVAAARQRTRAWGCARLRVATQLTNTGACRLYERCGFAIEQVTHVYHVWLT